MGAPHMIEPLINTYGETIAELDWRDNGDGTEWCKIDNGTITRRPDATVTVKVQDQKTGDVKPYAMPDAATAFYALGLCASRCNGIDGWARMALMPGTAGRD